MFFKLLHSNNQGFTFIELLIALVSISLIAIALSSFVTTSFRTNDLIISDTDSLVVANKVLNGIFDEAKYGFDFSVSSDNTVLSFLTPDYTDAGDEVNAAISLTSNKIYLDRDDGTRILYSDRHIIEDLSFTKLNPFNVRVTLQIDGHTYNTIIRSLNYVPPK